MIDRPLQRSAFLLGWHVGYLSFVLVGLKGDGPVLPPDASKVLNIICERLRGLCGALAVDAALFVTPTDVASALILKRALMEADGLDGLRDVLRVARGSAIADAMRLGHLAVVYSLLAEREEPELRDKANGMFGEMLALATNLGGDPSVLVRARSSHRVLLKPDLLYESIFLNGPQFMDIAIITIIPDEYEAFRSRLEHPQLVEGQADSPNLHGWVIGSVTRSDGRSYRVVLALAGQHATVPAALATAATIDKFKPRYVVLAGIAGGFAYDGCVKGDVVVSTLVYGYQYGNQGRVFSPRQDFTYRCDPGLVASAKVFVGQWPSVDFRHHNGAQPKVLFGQIASGDALVDDVSEGFFAAVLKNWPRLQAVEMEGAGAAGAIEHALAKGTQVGFIMVRGISDMPRTSPTSADAAALQQGQSAEREGWKKGASQSAAAFTIAWIARGWPVAPRETSTTQKTSGERATAADRVWRVLQGVRSSVEGLPQRLISFDFGAIEEVQREIARAESVLREESPYLDDDTRDLCDQLLGKFSQLTQGGIRHLQGDGGGSWRELVELARQLEGALRKRVQ